MRRFFRKPAALIAALAIAGCAVRGEPGPATPGVPLASPDFIRTTLVVRDMDASLALYRGAIGLQVSADREIATDGISAPSTGEPGARGRLVMLIGPDSARGMLGLIQWTDPPMPDPGPYVAQLSPGSVVLVMRVVDAATACAKAGEVPGVTVTAPLRDVVFGGPSGVRTRSCTLFDPDGNLVELSQRLP